VASAAPIVHAPPAPAASSAVPAANLTRRASLNAVQALLDYSARLLVGLVTMPILVRLLGQSMFGTWQVLGQLLGYLSSTDGRPTDALRLVVANRSAIDDARTMRRHVGSAVFVWLLFLPLIVLGGGALIWFAPALTKVSAELVPVVRFAAALLVLQFLLATLSAVPEAVLRGANLGYKRMGLQSGLQILGGVLAVGAVTLGLGLVGLSLAQVALAVVTAVCFWLLAKRYVQWFGVARPHKVEVRGMVRTSAWLAVGDLIAKLLVASDVVILGAVLSPAAATPYVLTGYASRTGVGIVALATLGAMPGLGNLIGQGHKERATALRAELLWMTWLATTVLGVAMLMWNRSFVRLWVGGEQYAGLVPNVLLVIATVQTAFIRCDSYIIDAGLRPRLRVVVGAIAAFVTIVACVALTSAFGLVGLCAGVVGGRLVQTIAYPIIAARTLTLDRARGPGRWLALIRPVLAMAALFVAAAILGERNPTASWPLWGVGVAVTTAAALILAYSLGLPAEARHAAAQRVRSALGGGKGATHA
jgi:O-antigen/teichoic acid export membrane protein